MRSQSPRRLLILSVSLFAIATISLVAGRAFDGTSSRSLQVQATSPGAVRGLSKRLSGSRSRIGPVGIDSSSGPNAFPSVFSINNAFGLSPGTPLLPMITGVKSAVLQTDVNGNTFVNPGDTLMYSVVVSNAGTDAMNVVFTDQLNGNLTLVGSATASPIATNDAYAVLGNVGLTVPVGSGLLVNDINPQGTGTVAPSAGTTTTQGGNVSVAANGSFTYNPPAGFEGADTFVYTLTHSNGKTDTGTVTFSITGMIWFIDNNAAACTTLAAGCGRLTNPFSTLASFQAINNGAGDNPATGDSIFLYRNTASDYTGPLTLLSSQKLGGQGMAVTLAGGAALQV